MVIYFEENVVGMKDKPSSVRNMAEEFVRAN